MYAVPAHVHVHVQYMHYNVLSMYVLNSEPSSMLSLFCSKVLLRVIAQVLKVQVFSKFVSDLAEEKDGMSLVYMHHNDSLRSGTSYQNEARISLRDNLDVS